MASPLLCNPFNEGLAAPAAGGHATSPFNTRPEALEPAGHPNFVRALAQTNMKVTPESSDAEPEPEARPTVSASPSPPTHYAAPLLHPVVSRSTSFVELPELYKVSGDSLVPNPVSRSTSDDTLALPPPPRKVVQPMRRGKWSTTEVALCVEIKILRRVRAESSRRVVLHAIDATPARWRGDAGSSPLDRARTAESSSRNDLVKNCRVHPTHWLISTQVALAELLIELFKAGRVPGCREGTTLRAFLAAELRCERMRISKKCRLCGNQPLRRVAALALSSGEEPTLPCHRAGVASMA